MPETATPTAMLGVIEHLEQVRAIGIDPSRGHSIHQARLSQLVREANKTIGRFREGTSMPVFAMASTTTLCTSSTDALCTALCEQVTRACVARFSWSNRCCSVAAVVST